LLCVKVFLKNRNLCALFLSLLQAIQDELQSTGEQLQSLSHVVSSLHPYLTASAADDVDHEFTVLREHLRDLNSEMALIADEVTGAYESCAKLQARLAEFDSRLEAADRSVAELSSVCVDELDSTVEVSYGFYLSVVHTLH